MVDAVDPDGLCDVVDAEEESVEAAAAAVLAGQFAAYWLADSSGVSCQVTERELDDRGKYPWRQLVEVSPGGGGEPCRTRGSCFSTDTNHNG